VGLLRRAGRPPQHPLPPSLGAGTVRASRAVGCELGETPTLKHPGGDKPDERQLDDEHGKLQPLILLKCKPHHLPDCYIMADFNIDS
jgi:hypothetical protein